MVLSHFFLGKGFVMAQSRIIAILRGEENVGTRLRLLKKHGVSGEFEEELYRLAEKGWIEFSFNDILNLNVYPGFGNEPVYRSKFSSISDSLSWNNHDERKFVIACLKGLLDAILGGHRQIMSDYDGTMVAAHRYLFPSDFCLIDRMRAAKFLSRIWSGQVFSCRRMLGIGESNNLLLELDPVICRCIHLGLTEEEVHSSLSKWLERGTRYNTDIVLAVAGARCYDKNEPPRFKGASEFWQKTVIRELRGLGHEELNDRDKIINALCTLGLVDSKRDSAMYRKQLVTFVAEGKPGVSANIVRIWGDLTGGELDISAELPSILLAPFALDAFDEAFAQRRFGIASAISTEWDLSGRNDEVELALEAAKLYGQEPKLVWSTALSQVKSRTPS